MTHRVLVVDDDRQIVRLVRTYLEQNNYEVLVAYDGETALQILRCERPDVMLLDLMLPDRDGWDVTRAVRDDVSLAAMPIIMLTARAERRDRTVDLELGADDYVAKPFNPHEVVARVRAVLGRVRGVFPAFRMVEIGPVVIDLGQQQVQVGGQAVHLTPTEFALLRALAEHPGHALTRLEMIEKGLGYSYEGLERTVDSHVKNLRHKLAEKGVETDLIETVFGVGYRLAAGSPPAVGDQA